MNIRMNNMYDNERQFYEMSCTIKTAIDSMTNLLDDMSADKLTPEKKDAYIDAMRYFIKNMKKKMDEIVDVTISDPKLIEESITANKYRDIRVLLVDDNEVNNFMTKQMLMRYGLEVDVALSGEEGLELYKNNQYDIVFMDYILPGINGIETVNEIRKCGTRGENQMIIGLSSYVMEVFKNELNKLGVELLLMKPVKPEQVGIILLKDFKHKLVTL